MGLHSSSIVSNRHRRPDPGADSCGARTAGPGWYKDAIIYETEVRQRRDELAALAPFVPIQRDAEIHPILIGPIGGLSTECGR